MPPISRVVFSLQCVIIEHGLGVYIGNNVLCFFKASKCDGEVRMLCKSHAIHCVISLILVVNPISVKMWFEMWACPHDLLLHSHEFV